MQTDWKSFFRKHGPSLVKRELGQDYPVKNKLPAARTKRAFAPLRPATQGRGKRAQVRRQQ